MNSKNAFPLDAFLLMAQNRPLIRLKGNIAKKTIGTKTMLSKMVTVNAAMKAKMAAKTTITSRVEEPLKIVLSAVIIPKIDPITPKAQNSVLNSKSKILSNLLAKVPPVLILLMFL